MQVLKMHRVLEDHACRCEGYARPSEVVQVQREIAGYRQKKKRPITPPRRASYGDAWMWDLEHWPTVGRVACKLELGGITRLEPTWSEPRPCLKMLIYFKYMSGKQKPMSVRCVTCVCGLHHLHHRSTHRRLLPVNGQRADTI